MGRPCEGDAPCHGRIGIGKGKAWPGSPRCPPGWNWRVLGMPPWRNIRALRPPSGKLAILNAEMRSAYGCTFCARVEDAACHAAPKSMGRQEALIRARRLKRCSLPISNLLNRILARSARHGKVDASYVATSLPPRYANVASGQGGCRACGARKRAASRRWNEEGAVRIMLSMSLKPLEPFPGMRHKWKALCLRCGKTVFPLLDNVRKGSGFRYCGWATSTLRKLGDPVKAATDPIEAGYEPLEDYPGVNRPWSCIHTPCGTRVAVKLAKVRSGFNPCPRCKTNGFDQEAPALVYVLHHSGFNSVKVGVTSTKSDRVRGFQSAGWVMVHCEQFAVGRTAWGVEQEVLRHIREDLGYPPYLSRDVMGSLGGWTETVCADLLPPFNLQTMVQETARSAR